MNHRSHNNPELDFSTLNVVGAGGHGRELAWLSRECWGDKVRVIHLVAYPHYLVERVNGNRVELLVKDTDVTSARYVVAVGDCDARRRLAFKCESHGLPATSLVHPSAIVSNSGRRGDGSISCAVCGVTTNVDIGSHTHINIGRSISHGVVLGNFVTLSPGVILSGHVRVCDGVFVGAGSTVINGSRERPLVIGDGAYIAAGACVTGPVEPGALMAGVPAVRKR